MQNKPNFTRFSPENDDLTKNKPNSKPIQSQFNERPKLMQSVYIQRITKKNTDMGPKKQTQFKANSKPISNGNPVWLCVIKPSTESCNGEKRKRNVLVVSIFAGRM